MNFFFIYILTRNKTKIGLLRKISLFCSACFVTLSCTQINMFSTVDSSTRSSLIARPVLAVSGDFLSLCRRGWTQAACPCCWTSCTPPASLSHPGQYLACSPLPPICRWSMSLTPAEHLFTGESEDQRAEEVTEHCSQN